ncbi:MAG: hypothetical protein KDA96_26175 [Planctomycetaceae bacterium]|nr:hypothetical protein [Planctomycetaceae bacterium]
MLYLKEGELLEIRSEKTNVRRITCGDVRNELLAQPERVSVRFLQKPRANALRLIVNAETECFAMPQAMGG